jgi:hypothetical protein
MKRQVTDALRASSARVPQPDRRGHRVPRADRRDLAAIVDLLVADLQRRIADQDLTLELTPTRGR